MALHPDEFAGWTLPDKGAVVRFAKKDQELAAGIVALVWLAEDTPCIEIQPILAGDRVSIFPEFGDVWEPAP